MRYGLLVSVALAAGITSAARAEITFSFASDSDPDHPTFRAFPGDVVNGLFDGGGKGDPVSIDLIIDTNGAAPGGQVTIGSSFAFEAGSIFDSYQVTPFGPGFIHSWSLSGSFGFVDEFGDEILTVTFADALMSSLSANDDALGQTATIQTSESFDASIAFIAGPVLQDLGIDSSDLSGSEAFAFTLTSIINESSPGSPIFIDGIGVWGSVWTAEGSFSAAAVPAPGAMALLLLGGIAATHRRRR